jgi:hypothetical protein
MEGVAAALGNVSERGCAAVPDGRLRGGRIKSGMSRLAMNVKRLTPRASQRAQPPKYCESCSDECTGPIDDSCSQVSPSRMARGEKRARGTSPS